MGIRDDIVNFFRSFFPSDGAEESTSFLDFVIDSFQTIVFFLVIGIGIFVFVRFLRHFTTYAGVGEELGSYKLHIMGRTQIKGNLNVNEDAINDGTIETLLQISHIQKGLEELKKLYKEGKFYIYDFRITDYDEMSWDIKGGKDSIIISPVDLQDSIYSWQDTKGERSIISPGFRSKSKNVFCYSTTEYLTDLEDPYGKLFDAYILSPIPRKVATHITGANNEIEAEIVIKNIGATVGKAFAIAVQYFPTIAETYNRIRPAEDETERLRDEVLKKDTEISDLYRKLENQRHIAIPNPLIGFKSAQKPYDKMSMAVWVLGGIMFGGIGAMLPELLPRQLSGIHPIITMGIMAIIFMAIYQISESKRKEKEPMTATEENI